MDKCVDGLDEKSLSQLEELMQDKPGLYEAAVNRVAAEALASLGASWAAAVISVAILGIALSRRNDVADNERESVEGVIVVFTIVSAATIGLALAVTDTVLPDIISPQVEALRQIKEML